MQYKARGIRETERRVSLSFRFPLEVHELQLEFLAQFFPLEVHELQLEFLAQFLSSSSPGSRFIGGGYWRHSRVVVGRSCSRSARVHERHGPAGIISPRASDHAGGRLGVEVESARLNDAFRKVATFIFFGVLCK